MLHKAIQKINQTREVRKSTSQQHSHFALHRGPEESSSDPYSYRRKLCFPRCSGVGYIAKQKYARISGIASLSILIILLTLAFCPVALEDPSAEATTGTSVPSTTTLTMALGSSSANLNIIPKDESGTFAASTSSESAEFGITTNNYTGYTLTISASDDNGLLTNTDTELTENNTLSSILYPTDTTTFTASSSFNGQWGYLPSRYNSEANLVFRPAPTTTASTLDTTTVANEEANDYTIGLGARVDYNKPAGTYTNTFVLNTVANPIPYVITYDDVTGDSSVTNLPDLTLGSTSATSIILSSLVPTRNHYAFRAWCLGEVSELGTVCTGTEYTAGGGFGIDQTVDNTATLYAVWDPTPYDITIKTVTGISKVTLNGTECTSTSGCVVEDLEYGRNYELIASAAPGYSFASWDAGANGTIANTSSSTTTYTVGGGDSTITPSATANKYNITIKTVTDVTKITLNGTECTSTSGCVVSNLEYGKQYDLSAVIAAGHSFASWDAGDYGTITNSSTSGSTVTAKYTVGAGDSTVTASVITDKYNITIKTATGISSVSLNGTSCTSTSGCTVSNLTYGQSYTLTATAATGYTFSSWNAGSNGTVAANSASTTYTVGPGTSTITPTATANQYTITLNGNGATTAGSTSTKATYNSGTLGAITVPQRKYTASGFTKTTSATNSTVSSTSTITSTYTFNGWYKESSATNKVASNAATPALVASTSYTDSNGKWTSTSAQTLYAGWTSKAITLPTITRTGSTCGWSTSSTATSWTYTSGQSITPTANLTLYGVCRNNITLNNNGATTSGSTSATATYGATSLSSITVPQRKYTVSGFTKGTGASSATISSTATLTNTATFNGWYTAKSGGTKVASNAATPALQASTTYTDSSKKWTYTTASAVTLYSQWTDKAVTLPTITLANNSCKWNTKSDGTGTSYNSGASITPTANLTLYGVCSVCNGVSGTMQSPTIGSCATSGTLSDSRDNQKYTVAKIGGKWWMTKNLAIGCNGNASGYGSSVSSKSLTSSDSNVSITWSTPTALLSAASPSTDTADYSAGRMQCDSTYGAWYNYYAATAGTISGTSNSTDATKDICPKGWRLPTQAEFSTITSSVSAFKPVVGGYYASGAHTNWRGFWWSSTVYTPSDGAKNRYRLEYDNESSKLNAVGANARYVGFNVRCVKS